MLRLLEILKWERGSVQSADLEKNYKDVPSNKSLVLSAARDYAEYGYAEIFDEENRKISPKETLDFRKNYTIRLTPAGEVLAAALPPLFRAKDPQVAHKFWMGTGVVLELLPQITNESGEIDLTLVGYGILESGYAIEQYIYAGLMTPVNERGISKITIEGLRFCAAVRTAEEMVEKQRHPTRSTTRRKLPGDVLVPQN